MKTVIHQSETRGHFNYGWLNTYHTFSFAGYRDNERIHFGTLRVLNDDVIKPSQGFGTHPHDNMEIITIVLSGALEHKDSMGHVSVIKENEVQVMSAGKGLHHAEYNHSKNQDVNILQIWIFPRSQNLDSRYDQKLFKPEDYENNFTTLVNPDIEKNLSIQQDAWVLRSRLRKDAEQTYTIKRNENGLYVFVISGSAVIAGNNLEKRDGLGIWETQEVNFRASSDCDLLLLDVPMQLPDR